MVAIQAFRISCLASLAMVLCLLLLRQTTAASLHIESCDILPDPACSCVRNEGKIRVICHDTNMTSLPILSPEGAAITEIDDLVITNTDMEEIGADSLRNVAITRLNLERNRLSGIHENAFYSQGRTMKYLSLKGNRLTSIPLAVRHLTSLKTLDLSHNNLVTVLPLFSLGLSNLESLHLDNNPIRDIKANSSFPSLHKLTMSVYGSYDVSEEAPGADNVTLSVVPESIKANLRVLVIKKLFGIHRNLLRREYPVIREVLNCKVLPGNHRYLIEYHRLQYLALEELGLTDIDVFKSNVGNFYSGLRGLSLKGNSLAKFPIAALARFRHLEHLDLSHNRIIALDYMYWVQMPRLRTLKLSSNQIKDIGLTTYVSFRELNSLERLDLRDNLMQVLPSNSKHQILSAGQMTTVQMAIGGNPWSCDCDNQWLIRSVQKEAAEGQGPFLTSEIYDDLRCVGGNATDELLLDVNLQALGC